MVAGNLSGMGRARRATDGNMVYHVLNRGNGKQQIFHKDSDFDAFLKVMRDGLALVPVRLLGFCIMPNHWHLVLWPRQDRDLTRFVGWITNTHVKRHRQHYSDSPPGHLYQGRFRSFPVKDDSHLLTVLRYVEANPLRARLCKSAASWRWSSLALRERGDTDGLLSEWPLPRPNDWRQIVARAVPADQLKSLRHSIARGTPFGDAPWVKRTAASLGLGITLAVRGRPRKSPS